MSNFYKSPIKRTTVSGRLPTTAQLNLGEIGINHYSGTLYIIQNTTNSAANAVVVAIGSTPYAANTLATPRTITLSGDVAGNVAFDGSNNVTITTTLANTGVISGTYGNFAINSKGIVVSAQTANFTGDVSGIANTANITLTLANVVVAGTYNSIVSDSKGRIISGINNAYLTNNQSITLSGDASGTGAVSISVTLANSGVIANTYSNLTFDSKGRAISARALSNTDISNALAYIPVNKTGDTAANLAITGTITLGGWVVSTPKTYGAVGNGVNDDTAALQSFFNSGKDGIIPDGVYAISSTILCNGVGARFEAAPGAIIRKIANTDAMIISTNNWELLGLRIDGNGFNGSGIGIKSSNSIIERTEIYGHGGHGIFLDGTISNCARNRVALNSIHNISGTGILNNAVNEIIISNNIISNCANGGIYVSNGLTTANSINNIVSNNLFQYNSNYDIKIDPNSIKNMVASNQVGASINDLNIGGLNPKAGVQCSFRAYANTARYNVTGNGTIYSVPLDGVSFNNGNGFNASTGVFTAPVSAVYQFSASCRLENAANQTYAQIQIAQSGSGFQIAQSEFDGNSATYNLSVSDVFALTAGDTIVMNVYASGGSKVVVVPSTTVKTFLSGGLVG